MQRLPVFAYGFRPFFLLAGVYALIAVPLWIWFYRHGGSPLPGLAPFLWHGHEMLYGFVMAAVGGFLLTSVPSWTGTPRIFGWPLIFLVSIWCAARIGFACAASLPEWVVGL